MICHAMQRYATLYSEWAVCWHRPSSLPCLLSFIAAIPSYKPRLHRSSRYQSERTPFSYTALHWPRRNHRTGVVWCYAVRYARQYHVISCGMLTFCFVLLSFLCSMKEYRILSALNTFALFARAPLFCYTHPNFHKQIRFHSQQKEM